MNDTIQFTGVVVNYNEAFRLRECLKSLCFCEQLIVIDMGSRDQSVEIARYFSAEIIRHPLVPVVEYIREEAVGYARNEWIVFIDPDEVFPSHIENNLKSLIIENPKLGLIKIPLKYYFKGKPLYFTKWGKRNFKDAVFHRQRVEFNTHVHRGIKLSKGYAMAEVHTASRSFICHYWIDSYGQLIKKHWRYIGKEGESRYAYGQRFSLKKSVNNIFYSFKYNLIDYQGIHGGFVGIFLSLFHAWYITMSLLSLLKYQVIRGRAG